MIDPQIFEQNLAALLGRAYVPVRPSLVFQRRCREEFLAQSREHVRRRAPLERSQAAPSRTRTLRVVTALLGAAAAVLLFAWLGTGGASTGNNTRPASLSDLLAQGTVAARTDTSIAFAAVESPIAHAGGFLELVTPEQATAVVHAGPDRLFAQADSHLSLSHGGPSSGGQATLVRGSLSVDVDESSAGWTLDSRPGRIRLAAAHEEATRAAASLEAQDLVVHLERGTAFAVTQAGEVALPLGESRLRSGELVTLLATATAREEVREAAAEPEVTEPVEDAPAVSTEPTGARLVGRVLDPGGALVEDFEVFLLIEQDYASVADPLRREFAAAGGEFEWSGIEPGSYDIFVRAPGFARWRSPSRAAFVEGGAVTVEAKLAAGAEVRGAVVDAKTGQPIAGAVVLSEADVPLMALPINDSEELREIANLAVSASDGSFQLQRLRPGWQLLRVTAPGLAPGWSARFELHDGDLVEGMLFELEEEARVAGRVFGNDGLPLTGCDLVAAVVDSSGVRFCMSYAHAVTDVEGRYEMGSLPQEFGVVVLFAEGFQSAPEIQPVSLRRGTTQQVVFGEERAGTLLFGTLRNTDGSAAALTPISVAPAGVSDAFQGWRAGSTTDAGNFRFEGIDPGSLDFFISYGMTGSVTLVDTFEVPAWPEVERNITLPPASIEGQITRAADGSPTVFTIVIVESVDASEGPRTFVSKSMTGQDGHYIVKYLAPGRYRVSFYSMSSALASTAVEVEVGEESVVQDVALEAGAWATLQVRGASGQPVAGALVKVYDVETGVEVFWEQNPFTDRDGRLRLSPSAATLTRIVVTAEGHAPVTEEHRLTIGEQELLVVIPGL